MPREFPLPTIIGLTVAAFIFPAAVSYGLYLLGRSVSRPGPTPASEPLPERMSFFHPKSELIAEVALNGIIGVALLTIIALGLGRILSATGPMKALVGGLWILLTLPLVLWLLAKKVTLALTKLRVPAIEVDGLGITHKKKRILWRCVGAITVVSVARASFLSIQYVDAPLSTTAKQQKLVIPLIRISDSTFCVQVVRYWKRGSSDNGAYTG